MKRPLGDWLTARAFAHRGLHDARRGVPENSLPAFAAAIAAGYGIELDVRRLASGEPVVFHDRDLARMTGRKGAIADIARRQLSGLHLASTAERVPLLSEVLDMVRGRVPVLIEIKNDGRAGALEQKVAKLLTAYEGPFAVISFNPFSLAWFRRHAPAFVRGQTAAAFRGRDMPLWRRLAQRDYLLNIVSRPDFLLYEIGALPRRSVALLRALGWPLLVYTVTTQAEREKALTLADNYIFENLDR
ncbi:MAG: glycerophosphodiester phosphodiesterase family protein [Alphaproteobacteria bacterium]